MRKYWVCAEPYYYDAFIYPCANEIFPKAPKYIKFKIMIDYFPFKAGSHHSDTKIGVDSPLIKPVSLPGIGGPR